MPVVPSVSWSATNPTAESNRNDLENDFAKKRLFDGVEVIPVILLYAAAALTSGSERAPICNTRFTGRRNSLKASRGPAAIL